MQHEARVSIAGRKWRVRLVPAREMPRDALGDCDHPPGRHPTIRIRRNLPQRDLLDTAIHEVLHASLPALSEEAVTETAHDIARVLFSLGWRRKPLASRHKAKT